ncbi:MAG TPA: PQQ-dependent sugar dehydrogenase, partial [Chitinophagales bacterium]|nr:PQQ-dependent sugar dehydrogenase [Chitinophagales bacterium]
MSNFYSYLYSSIFMLVVMALPVLAQPTGINLVTFSTGYSRPLSIENCGDERLFIVQQRGLIVICDLQGNKLPTPFLDLTGVVNQTGNECGLLGLAFHPNYATNGYFYVN